MGNEMGNINASSMKVEEGIAEAHFQDQFSSSFTDPFKKQITAEDYITPAGAEEIEEKQVISISQDHPDAADQIKNQLTHARDESLTAINESCDAAIHHLVVEEKAARQVAGLVSKETEGSKAEHESITVVPELIVIDKSSSKRTNIDGAEMPPTSFMFLEDEGFIYLNLKEAICDKNPDNEKETVDTGDQREREMISSPYIDLDAKYVKSLNQIRAQSSINDQVDENTFQEKQDTEEGSEHEENNRSHSIKTKSDEPDIVACKPLVQLEDGKSKMLSKSTEFPESSSQHNDIQIEKHIQNMVLNIVEDRHGVERRECKDQSNVAHKLPIEKRGEITFVNEDELRQIDVIAIDTTAYKGQKESAQPMTFSLMLDEMAEPKHQYEKHEDVNATYFTPRGQSKPLEFSSDNEIDKPKEGSCGISSSALEIVLPCPTVCEIKKGNGAIDGLEGNFLSVQFSVKETDQSEVVAQVTEDKTKMFPRSQDDKTDQESKEVVPSTPRISENKIEKENLETFIDEQRGDSEKANQMKDGDMKGFHVKEDDQLASKSTVKHDLKFLTIEDEPEMEVCSPTNGAINNGIETVKDDVLIEQAKTTEAIKSKDDTLEIISESELFGQPNHLKAEKILAESVAIIHDHCNESQTQKRCPPLDHAILTNTTNDITTGVASVKPILENKTSRSMEEDVNLLKILDGQSQKIVLQPATQIGDHNDVLIGERQSSFSKMNDSGEHLQSGKHLEEAKLKSDSSDQRKVAEAEKHCLKSGPTTEEGNGTGCTINNGPNAEIAASIDIDESQNSDSAKVSASEGSESSKLRSPLKIFFKTCTMSRPIKEESRKVSNTGDSLTCHLEKMSLPSSGGGREKQKARSIFTNCMCCTAVIR